MLYLVGFHNKSKTFIGMVDGWQTVVMFTVGISNFQSFPKGELMMISIQVFSFLTVHQFGDKI